MAGRWEGSFWSERRSGSSLTSKVACVLGVMALVGLMAMPSHLHASSGDIYRLIHRVAGEEGVDAGLLRAIVDVESEFRADLVSEKGAGGLMQLMPATARILGVTNRFNPEQSLRGGARYIKRLIGTYPSLSLALAAYNAGPGNVDKFGGMPPFPETKSYVRRVMAKYAKEVPAKKGIPLRPVRPISKEQSSRDLASRDLPLSEPRKKTVGDHKSPPELPKVAPVASNTQGFGVYGFLHRSSYLAKRHAVASDAMGIEMTSLNGLDSDGNGMTTEIPIIRMVYN
ncbi:MAG TPA: transglycosylase SLT domain-containing protein [Magnetococcales bacterium]|nr:transglycosylase SLT domain-containing protein [Magnetococcales bacterium]